MTHSELCDAAVRWLSGTMDCNVALSGIASTREIPDAIGWSTSWKHYGSIVVECKVSISDFKNNQKKKHGNALGNYRYFLVPDGMVTKEQVCELYPGHGLLYLRRGRVSKIMLAAQREKPDLEQEVRLLQFALVHVKDNLLSAGCAVNMNTLTKHSITNYKNSGSSWYHEAHDYDYGVEFPTEPYTFNKGECK